MVFMAEPLTGSARLRTRNVESLSVDELRRTIQAAVHRFVDRTPVSGGRARVQVRRPPVSGSPAHRRLRSWGYGPVVEQLGDAFGA